MLSGVNPETVDSEYAKLEGQAQQTVQAIQALAAKLKAAGDAGNMDAREWLLDLKTVALAVQSEQLAAQSLMQAVHDMTVDHLSAPPPPQYQQPQYQPPQPQYQQYQPAYAPQPMYQQVPAQGGGLLGRFMQGGFGRAIMTGAGFAIGDDIINDIF